MRKSQGGAWGGKRDGAGRPAIAGGGVALSVILSTAHVRAVRQYQRVQKAASFSSALRALLDSALAEVVDK